MEWAYGQGFDSPHLHQLDNVNGEHIEITSLQGLVVSFFMPLCNNCAILGKFQ